MDVYGHLFPRGDDAEELMQPSKLFWRNFPVIQTAVAPS